MKIKVKEAADFVGGEIFGNPDLEFSNVAKIEEADQGDLTFLYLSAYQKFLDTTKASVILIKSNIERTRDDITYIVVENPQIEFQKIISKYFDEPPELNGIDPSAFIDESVQLGDNISIGKNVVIERDCKIGNNVKIFHNCVVMKNSGIGDNSLLYPNVTIREKSEIGNKVIIHPGTVIGSDGFGFASDDKGVFHKIPQIGNVIIEDNVELGSNVSVDRASLGSTVIKKGAKIDNLVQIAHNVIIGENTVISAQTGVSGSTKVGKNCMFGGQVGIVGHIEIADEAIILAQSGVSKGIPNKGKYFGSPAKEIKVGMRLEGHIRQLPEYAQKLKEIEEKLDSLNKDKSKES